MNIGAAIALKQATISAAKAGVGPAHKGLHEAATDAGFVPESHDDYGSSYSHANGTQLRTQPNGNWNLSKAGTGAANFKKHVAAYPQS